MDWALSDCNGIRNRNCLVRKQTINQLAKLAKLVSNKEFLDIQATTDCRLTLKRVCGMIRTYSQWIGVLTLSLLLKLPPRKLDPWFVLWSFFFLRLLCISIILQCGHACSHVWAGAPDCYFELLDKLQKRIRRTVGPSLAASLEPLIHRRNVARLSLFYTYYFSRCSSELDEIVPLSYSRGTSARYSDKLHDISVTIPSFFPCTARLWYSLSTECFPFCYDLHGFNPFEDWFLMWRWGVRMYIENSGKWNVLVTFLSWQQTYIMACSLASLIKLTREELANTVLDYQHKFDNSLDSINAELLKLKTKLTRMESDLTISRNVNEKLIERLVVTERKC